MLVDAGNIPCMNDTNTEPSGNWLLKAVGVTGLLWLACEAFGVAMKLVGL